jgi:hypothetical protein
MVVAEYATPRLRNRAEWVGGGDAVDRRKRCDQGGQACRTILPTLGRRMSFPATVEQDSDLTPWTTRVSLRAEESGVLPMLSIYDMAIKSRQYERRISAAAERRRHIDEAIRRVKARDRLRRAITNGLDAGLAAHDLVREISLTLDRVQGAE